MILRHLLLLLAALVLGAAAWRHADTLSEWFGLRERPSLPRIEFDNGSVRRYVPAEWPDGTGPLQGERAIHGVRKCQRGDSVVYTDGPCPSGLREAAVRPPAVSVVPSGLPAAAAKPAKPAASAVELRDARIDAIVNR